MQITECESQLANELKVYDAATMEIRKSIISLDDESHEYEAYVEGDGLGVARTVQAKHIDIFPDLKMAIIYEQGYPDEIFNEVEKA